MRNSKITVIFLIFCCVIICTTNALSTTIHVPADRATIQAGINFAYDGDTVLVAPGTYEECIDFLGKTISVISESGSDVTFLRPLDQYTTTVTINGGEGLGTVLNGFTIENGGDVITVMIGNGSQPTIEYNLFRNNISAAIYPLTVIMVESPTVIRYNLFYNNGGMNVIWSASSAEIINNTIVGNERGIYSYESQTIAINNIVVNNNGFGIQADFEVLDYNNAWNNITDNNPGPNGISEDPLFVDASNHNYNLMESSPCHNAGDPNPLYNDLDGTRNDMGAFPKLLDQPLAYYILYGLSYSEHTVYSPTPEISWIYFDSEPTTQEQFHIQIGTDEDWTTPEMWDSGPVASSQMNTIYNGLPLDENSTYFLRIKVNDGTDWGDWTFSWFNTLINDVIYVPDQFPTIQAGINFANDFDTVLVAPGTYYEFINYRGKSISIISEGGPDVTILLPPEDVPFSRLITINEGEGPGTLFRGFTVEMGYSGTYYSDVTILSIGPFSLPTIEYNIFRNFNLTEDLSVITVESASIIRYNLFYGNHGSNCIWATKCAKILNNTIHSNDGGIYSLSGKCIVKNNIVTNNYYYGIAGYFEELDYNNVWYNGDGNDPGPNGISENPKFYLPNAHDYTLHYNSPCIDAGDPDPLFNDLNGTRNDIGAYPYQSFATPFAKYITYGNSTLDHIVFSMTPEIMWTYYDDDEDDGTNQEEFQIQVGTDEDWTTAEMWDSGPVVSTERSTIYNGIPLDENGTYFLRIRVNNGTNWGDWTFSWFNIHLHQTIHVPADFSTIQEAIDYSYGDDSILVNPGIYIEQVDFLGKKIVVVSTQGPEVTTIQAPESGGKYIYTAKNSDTAKVSKDPPTRSNLSIAVLINTGEQKGAEISGFTITGGRYTGLYCNGTSPIITNNIITGNSSIYENISGGIQLENTIGSLIKGNIICNNNANTYGAAIQLLNCTADTICYNLSYNNYGYGDIRCLTAYNTIIYNNTLLPITYSGIFKQGTGNVYAYNNIIAWSPVFGVRSAGGWVYSSHNCTWQNYYGDYDGSPPGEGDVYADPLFASVVNNNYNLLLSSPCIDAGDPDPFFNDPDGSINDIGIFTTGCDEGIDTDTDGVPDGCDNCPNIANVNQADSDNDAVGDICDNCPDVPNYLQLNGDGDSYANACDNCPDIYNPGQEDIDEDLAGDPCDNCPDDYNPNQEDIDEDGIGDICDWICGDADGNEVIDILDVVFIINYKYKEGPAPVPEKSADIDGLPDITILDVVYLINFKYKNGPDPICP